MFKKILAFFPLILKNLPVEIAKKAVDAALDVIENEIEKSPTKIDDIIILPIIAIVRKAANIPDNDPVEKFVAQKEKTEKESHH